MFEFSIVLPTYRRPEVLELCLEHLCRLEFPVDAIEVRVYDNGGEQNSRSVVEAFHDRLNNLSYILNPPGRGLGFSLTRGSQEATGRYIVEMNDDAIVPPDLLQRLRDHFESDPAIGVVGLRAIEEGYVDNGGDIGSIDFKDGSVHGNFVRQLPSPIDVEHIYGFCYAYRREILNHHCHHDQTLLAKNYSTGNRIETDQCLLARHAGFRVVYDGTLAVEHLAKPRGDIDERSLKWRRNHVRNTLYLFLKHYGLFGQRSLAVRFALTHDVGIRSALMWPSAVNLRYFANSMIARGSAFGHYALYRCNQPTHSSRRDANTPLRSHQTAPQTETVRS